MKCTMLGTGHAMVTKCYNTCFILEENKEYFLVDAGGGNTILSQLEKVNLQPSDIHTLFVTHKHLDHITGVLWLLRCWGQYLKFSKREEVFTIYSHKEVIEILHSMALQLLPSLLRDLLGKQIQLIETTDGQTEKILGYPTTFFDIQSKKDVQFGFCMHTPIGKISCCGDEPYHICNKDMIENSTWLFHEAFCLDSQAEIFHPYFASHSTVKDACNNARQLHIQNLVLYHTEDTNLQCRKELYTNEGKRYYSGNLFVPDDLESIEIK